MRGVHPVGPAVPGVAVVAALAAWGLPLVWIAGVQDLWMMTLALGALLAFLHARAMPATVLFALALLSKETAARPFGAGVPPTPRRGVRSAVRR